MRQAQIFTVFAVCVAVAAVASGDIDNNDQFGLRSAYDASGQGYMTVTGDISGGSNALLPDTLLGAFDEFGAKFAEDDDASTMGNGFASGLYRVPINADGSINLAVTGYDDFDFDGQLDRSGGKPHKQSGAYDLYVDIRDAGGDLTGESFLFENTLVVGLADRIAPDTSSLPAGAASFDAYIDNISPYIPGSDPVDFFSFTGLTPGDRFEAEIVSGDFDTVLGWFSASGNLLEIDDDITPTSLLSKLTGVVPEGGELIFAVSGFSDGSEMDTIPFDGRHSASGTYGFELNMNPEPATLIFLTAGLPVLLKRRKRSK